MKSVLSIAGSDSSGGAGIQADIKTIQAHHLFAQTAITALTAQNTTGVYGVLDVEPAFVEQQIDVVFEDIRPDAVKIGMVSSPAIVDAIAEALVRNDTTNIVVDPVMVATSGSELSSNEAVIALREKLIPLATVITPNMPEAEVLFGAHIENAADQEHAAVEIARLLNIPECGNLVRRTRNTRPQKGLAPSDRRKNLSGAFHVPDGTVFPETVLLVDDIYTTGATMDELTETVMAHGAKQVYFAAIAIAPGMT